MHSLRRHKSVTNHLVCERPAVPSARPVGEFDAIRPCRHTSSQPSNDVVNYLVCDDNVHGFVKILVALNKIACWKKRVHVDQ